MRGLEVAGRIDADEQAAREAVGMVAQQPGTLGRPRILLSGTVPPLADAYYPRPETGPDLASTLHPGQTVVLTHGGETDSAPAAQGGTGKTQLAVEFAHALWNRRAVEVLVWVTASQPRIGHHRLRAGGEHGRRRQSRTRTPRRPRRASSPGWRAPGAPWALILDDLAEREPTWTGCGRAGPSAGS